MQVNKVETKMSSTGLRYKNIAPTKVQQEQPKARVKFQKKDPWDQLLIEVDQLINLRDEQKAFQEEADYEF